jgi:hypothetical protein
MSGKCGVGAAHFLATEAQKLLLNLLFSWFSAPKKFKRGEDAHATAGREAGATVLSPAGRQQRRET